MHEQRESTAIQAGAHVSAQGGVHTAPDRGTDIGADCIQVFTRNQRQWEPKPLDDAEAGAFVRARGESGLRTVMSHGSYLINLAAPDPEKAARSFHAMEAELDRCHRLGIDMLNFHPGAHMKAGIETGVARIAEALNALCARNPEKGGVRLVLENVAGQGTTVGKSFSELAAILARLEAPERFAVCVDTAHAFAAGYDLHTDEGWETTWAAFDRELGLDRLAAFHVNDSAVPFEARKDRHANLGRGAIGTSAFRRLVRDPRTRGAPMFLETPGGPERWREEIRWLRALAAGMEEPPPQPPPS
ncbi:deoxyribonuclease IV [Thiohalorhabdus methylotrophus]|uniref:Probable endonuclease 4 n=1 Tax=Thiohalorhabdus methylotrophus TaxID=3242694 RepID=A0ABV4U058_9GAMM